MGNKTDKVQIQFQLFAAFVFVQVGRWFLSFVLYVNSRPGQAFASDNNTLFIETSAKKMKGVVESFEAVVDKV